MFAGLSIYSDLPGRAHHQLFSTGRCDYTLPKLCVHAGCGHIQCAVDCAQAHLNMPQISITVLCRVLLTLHAQVDPTCEYKDMPHAARWDEYIQSAGGINQPKVVRCVLFFPSHAQARRRAQSIA